MSESKPHAAGRVALRLLSLGALTVGLYASLFLLEQPLLHLSAEGGWMFVIPVVIAFVFSLVHGSFTSLFWDALGVKAKK